ncbi:MAG TPA: tetratricopeptide repeat protein [Bacteroidales bacterium]|nr:tetratricopeptide repeat protein [Bacteroidales bacterium]
MKESKNTLPADPITIRKIKTTLGIIIIAFALLLYVQSVFFDYACDDISVIPENNLVQQGFSAIPTLLTTDRLFGANDGSERMPEYRPVPMILFAMEWQFFPDNPHIYHLMNVLLYALTCWLLFLVLCKLFKSRNLILPFACTLLFAAHPVHTEVVANIKSLDEILCFLFALLSAWLFIAVLEKRSVLKFVTASVCFFFSLLSKETGIAFLIIIPLILFMSAEKTDRKKLLFNTAALTVVSVAFLIIRFQVLAAFPKDKMEVLNSSYYNSLLAAPDFLSQKATAFYMLLRYVFLLIFPYNLSYDYSFAVIQNQQILSPGAIAGIVLYLFIGIYAIIKIRKKDPIAFAILFFLLTLAPVSNIFFLIHWTMAERFLFMPSLGFCLVLALLLIKITKTEIYKSKFKTIGQLIKTNAGLFILLCIITGLYSFRTTTRNPDWKDSTALFSHDVKVVPNSARAHFNYGNVLLFTLYPQEKNPERQLGLLKSAVKEYAAAATIFPDFSYAYYYLGGAYFKLGDAGNAIINYEKAARYFHPAAPAPLYCDLGLLYCNEKQYGKATSILDTCVKYYPGHTDAYAKKSFVYLSEGKNEEAIAECDKLLKIDPENIFAYMNKGCGYINMKQYAQGIEALNQGLKIDSTNAECLRFLGIAYMNLGDSLTASRYFEKEYRVLNK